ncbi:hypothetical protein C808_03096 [Lachnospiraceae bacterium M18-1]|nr:hypothetical protein C808_03096 [Lachnospiraceae bacterium M18-1]
MKMIKKIKQKLKTIQRNNPETNSEHLDSVDMEKEQAILVNAIRQCMADNRMTLEVLDDAYQEIQFWYRKNALIPKCGKVFEGINGTSSLEK